MLESGVKKVFYLAFFKVLVMSFKGCENGGVLGLFKDFKVLFNCIWYVLYFAFKIVVLVFMIFLVLRSFIFKENFVFLVCIVIFLKL